MGIVAAASASSSHESSCWLVHEVLKIGVALDRTQWYIDCVRPYATDWRTVTMYTEASNPPAASWQRKAPWRSALEESRTNQGQWRRVLRPMTEMSAQQTASDVRNSSNRKNNRFKVPSHEKWNATYGQIGDKWYVWIRYEGGVSSVPF